MKHYIIPIFVPHLGCPHDCVFCNQKKITNSIVETTKETVVSTIEKYLSYFDKDAFIEVAFYGGSFTAIDFEVQKELLSIPYKYKRENKINAIRLSTRPDSIDEKILRMLNEYDVDIIELGVQSMNENVLNKSGRGHNAESVYKAFNLIKEFNIECGLQMMLGLPEDNTSTILYTTKEFIKMNPFCVRIYPTLVIKDTYLEEMYYSGQYNPLTVEEAINESIVPLILFELNNINVIRVGLQVTDNIQLGQDVVTGPFHPAFKQVLESEIMFRIINGYLKENITRSKQNVTIKSNSANISNIAGQKAKNKIAFIDMYDLFSFKILEDEVDENTIELKIDEKIIKLNLCNEKLIIVEKILNNTEYCLKDFNL